MASEGPNNPGTMADDATIGTKTWSNVDNAKISDDTDATVFGVNSADITHYLKATNFGFSIPIDATINGILVEVEKSNSFTNHCVDASVKIIKGGSIGSENKADTTTRWDNVDTVVPYGGESDLWSESWTYEDINNSNFGVVFAAEGKLGTINVFVDHIAITVFYTEASATINPKIKIAGTFSTKTIKTKISETFTEKPIKVKVSGVFQ